MQTLQVNYQLKKKTTLENVWFFDELSKVQEVKKSTRTHKHYYGKKDSATNLKFCSRLCFEEFW